MTVTSCRWEMIRSERLQRGFIVSWVSSYPLRYAVSFEATNFAWVCKRECVCVSCCYSQQNRFAHCCSHCQSQITNDTNSPRALTISTLARLTLSACVTYTHTHTHAHTHMLRTQSLTLSLSWAHLARSLTHTHTRINETQKGSATRCEAKPEGEADLKQVPSCSQCECVCVRVSLCVFEVIKKTLSSVSVERSSKTSQLFIFFSFSPSFFALCCCLRLPKPSLILHMQIARAVRARQQYQHLETRTKVITLHYTKQSWLLDQKISVKNLYGV